MKHVWILFLLLVAIWLAYGATLFVPESPNARGVQLTEDEKKTAKFKEMAKGGSGLERHESLLWIGWTIGALQMVFFTVLLAFGIRRRGRLNNLTVPLLFGVVLEIGVLTGIFVSYQQYLHSSDPMLLGPFPAPTTFMVFGIWGAPFYYVFLYVSSFSRCIWTPEDEAEFHELVRARRQAEGPET